MRERARQKTPVSSDHLGRDRATSRTETRAQAAAQDLSTPTTEVSMVHRVRPGTKTTLWAVPKTTLCLVQARRTSWAVRTSARGRAGRSRKGARGRSNSLRESPEVVEDIARPSSSPKKAGETTRKAR